MRCLLAGNWKMNGLRAALAEIRTLERGLAENGVAAEILVCPPATLISAVAKEAGDSPIVVGGQDCHAEASGAFTGDISAEMLKDAGASHVIVGHSERRQYHGETDAAVAAKVKAAQRAGLSAILCVGETETDRGAGRALAVVAAQLGGSIPETTRAHDLIVAYEPVWAIGTGRTPTVAQIAEVHASIRGVLVDRFGQEGKAIRILYGGSVKPANAAEILAVRDVGGALIGAASLKAADFLAIALAAPLQGRS